MLSARRLRIFVAVAEHGSFSAAAYALTYTQSAVSQQMAQLEREAGAKLVERSAKGVELTAAGRVLLDHARALLELLDGAEADVRALGELRGGELRFAAFTSAWGALVPQAAHTFRERYPAIALTLVEASSHHALAQLKAGALDLALVCEPTPIPLFEDPFRVIVAAGHPLAARTAVTLEEIADERIEAEGWQALQGLVAAGLGVGLVPALALLPRRCDLAVLELTGGPARTVYAATPARTSEAATAMIAVIRELAAWTTRRARAGSRPRSPRGTPPTAAGDRTSGTCATG
jgi:DNA-binding transcriptional LysR family regulator